MADLSLKVKRFIEINRLVDQGDRIVVGVSGGPDSLALFDILLELIEEKGVILYVVHLDHMFRGEESREDAEYVRSLCKERGVPAFIESVDVHEYSVLNGLSHQVAAREVRYRLFYRVASEIKGNKLALAHHRDDQVETMIMRFLRGAGITGLAAMRLDRPIFDRATGWRGRIIRPLLDSTRDEIERYCKERGYIPRIDRSNLEPLYRRNRIRLELMPELLKYNPNLKETLSRMARVFADEDDLLEEMGEREFEKARMITDQPDRHDCASVHRSALGYAFQPGGESSPPDPGEVILNRSSLRGMHPALLRRVLMKAVSRSSGSRKDIYHSHIDDLSSLVLAEGSGGSMDLPGGVRAFVSYNTLRLTSAESRPGEAESPKPFRYALNVPGETLIEEQGLSVRIELFSREEFFSLFPDKGVWNGESMAAFDGEKISGPLVLRSREAGDRFQPMGMKGRKRLKDFFIDEKVEAGVRDQVPIITAGGGIIWVVGYRISDAVKISDSTERIMAISIDRHR